MNWICVGFGPPGYIAAVEMRGEGRVKLGEGGGVQTRNWCHFGNRGSRRISGCEEEEKEEEKRFGGRRKEGKEM